MEMPPLKARPQALPGKIGTASGASVEPGGARPDIRIDVTHQLDEVKDPTEITQQLLQKTVVRADYQIQHVKAYVRAAMTGDHATADFDTYNTGYKMWWEHAKTIDYDNLEADQILHLAVNRGLVSEEDEGELGALATKEINLNKLYVEDYDNFVMITKGARDHIVGIARLDAFRKAITVSPAHVAFRVTLFATTASLWSLSRDELEWIAYLLNAEYTMKL
jgi:hypothetical protein